MTPLLIALALQTALVAPPASAPAAPPAAATPITPPSAPPAEAQPTTADTLAGLEETYRVSCAETGILYYGYAELCDSLRKQISEYRRKVDREAAAQAKAAAKH